MKEKYSIKKHMWFYDFERMWLLLTLINVVAIFLIIRGSSLPLVFDNDILHFLFYSNPLGDKTLYNISISYFAAYIFYIIQIYYPERKKCKQVLISTSLPVRNLINQTNMFLFVWETFTQRNSPDDGVILGVNVSKIYYKNRSGFVMSADKEELPNIIKRIEDDYDEITNNIAFQSCDNALRQLLLEINIPYEMNRLYQTLLSAELLAQDSSTTILESYSNDDVAEIRTRLKKLNKLFNIKYDFTLTTTTDSNDIKERDEIEKSMQKIIFENFDYFSKLPDSYKETLK